jgi:hypothetical protein
MPASMVAVTLSLRTGAPSTIATTREWLHRPGHTAARPCGLARA